MIDKKNEDQSANLRRKHMKNNLKSSVSCSCWILLLTYVILTQINANALILKPNQLVNGQFNQPRLTGMMGFYNFTIPGWSCSWLCQLSNCQIFQRVNVGYNLIFSACEGQVIDLNSINNNEIVTQIVELKSGHFLLSLNYYYPIYNANQKIIYVYFNQELIFHFQPPSVCLYQKFNKEIEVQGKEGYNNLTLTMSGPTGDGSGFNLNNISLRRIEDTFFETVVNITLKNSLIKSVISLPAYRTLLGEVTNFFIALDRMQLYFFHKRNYSYCWGMFLENVNELMNLKGTFVQNQLDFMLGSLTTAETSFLDSLDYKKIYDGDGFFVNNSSIVIYSLPLIILIVLFGYFVFNGLFHQPFSRLFRKYSMLGIFLFCLCDGNIEQFTYYIMGEFLQFFSTSFKHKLVNTVLLIIFFIVLFTAIASFLWFKAHYRHLVSYFLDNNRAKLCGVLSATMDKGIVCLLLGATHRLLIDYPDIQLAVLGVIELFWIFTRCFFLSWQANICKLVVFVGIGGSILRILFQLSSVAYSASGDIFLNEFVHKKIIYIFLLNWGFEFLLNFYLLLSELPTYFRQKIRKKDVSTVDKSITVQHRINKQSGQGQIDYRSYIFNDQAALRKANKWNSGKPVYHSLNEAREKVISKIKMKRQKQARGERPKFSIY